MIARSLLAAGLALATPLAAGAQDESTAGPRSELREDSSRPVPRPASPFDTGIHSFAEVGVSVFKFTAESSDSQLGGTLRGGLAFNGVFAVEADFSALENADGVIIGAGDVSGPDFTVVREPDRVSAAFARASWPLTDRLSAHARLGFARLDATNETGGHDSADGAAYGVGASLAISGPTALRLDYTRMALDDLDADVGALMFVVRF